MKSTVVVDTDVLVDFLRGVPAAVDWLKAHAAKAAIPAIVVAELYAGARDPREIRQLDEFIGLFPVLPAGGDVARDGGLYRKQYGPSHGVGLADAIIGATARSCRATLATLNTRHFPMLPDITPPYAKG
jgi:predicted nucleic acid-binding protein